MSILTAAMRADDAWPPTYQIPRLDHVVIDGDAADWAEGGFRVNVLAPADGQIVSPADSDASIRIAWSDMGLLVFATVTSPRNDAHDSIDLVLHGEGSGAARHVLIPRAGVSNDEVNAVSKATPHGFAIEALVPFHDRTPTHLQIVINAADKTWLWNPLSEGANAIALAKEKSAAVDTAIVCVPQHLRRQRVTVLTAPSNLGRRVEISTGPSLKEIAASNRTDLPLAVGAIREISGRPGAILTVSLRPLGAADAPLNVYIDSQLAGKIMPVNIDALRRQALAQIDMKFKPAVFSGKTFPRCDFADPAEARDLIGAGYTFKTTFYDAQRKAVDQPAAPGRYGAVVRITTDTGVELPPRLVTLFRPKEPDGWREEDLDLRAALPPQLGVDPQVVQQQQPAIAEHLSERFFDGFSTEPDAALLLAALFDAKPGGPLLAGRNSIWASDQRWWYPLKEQLSLDRYKYLVDLPPGYEKGSSRYPLLLFLHGSGECGDDLEQVRLHGPPRTFPAHNPGFILVSPQCPAGQWWCAQQLKNLLDEVQRNYRVDPDRVCITGLSMGGYGAWELAAEYPERFAAVAPCCGAGSPQDADRLKQIPAWIFHGQKDPIVPFSRSRQMADALKQAGGVVKFTPYPDLGHDCWTATYNNPELYQWLLKQKRGAQPPHI